MHSPTYLKLVHHLGLENGRKVTDASNLSAPLLNSTLTSWPGLWQRQTWQGLYLLLPQAAPEVLSSKLLQSLYTHGGVATSNLTHPVGKPQGNQLLNESKAEKCQGGKLEGQRLHFCGFTQHNRGTLASSQIP